jgi:hypothetical protein
MRNTKLKVAAATLFLVAFQSCSKSKEGCLDSKACNYDASANYNFSSFCIYETKLWYQDLDGDGLGDRLVSVRSCLQPLGYVANDHDADLVVEAKQRAVVTYVGSTSSPICGAYGGPMKIYIEQTYGSDVILLNAQYNDLISPFGSRGAVFGNTFQSFVSNTVVPQVYLSAANYAMVNSSLSLSHSENNSAADTAINACLSSTLEVGVAATAFKTEDRISVITLCKFYAALGEHYIGIYLLEDGVMAVQQNSLTGPGLLSHDNVIRSTFIFGTDLMITSMGSSFALNQEVSTNNYFLNLNYFQNIANLQVAVVIFKSNQADGISNAIIVDVN